jgi:hypothetical protein
VRVEIAAGIFREQTRGRVELLPVRHAWVIDGRFKGSSFSDVVGLVSVKLQNEHEQADQPAREEPTSEKQALMSACGVMCAW